MSLKLDALLQMRPKSARIFAGSRTQKCGVSELPLTQGGPDTYPAGCWTIDKKNSKVQGVERLFGGHFSGRGPKINPFFETLLFFCPVGRGRVLLEDPGDISAVMG